MLAVIALYYFPSLAHCSFVFVVNFEQMLSYQMLSNIILIFLVFVTISFSIVYYFILFFVTNVVKYYQCCQNVVKCCQNVVKMLSNIILIFLVFVIISFSIVYYFILFFVTNVVITSPYGGVLVLCRRQKHFIVYFLYIFYVLLLTLGIYTLHRECFCIK